MRASASLAALLALLPGVALAQAPDAAVEAARGRQEKVKTADIRIRLTEVVAEGAINRKTFTNPATDPVPPRATTLTIAARLVLDGKQSRAEANHPLWHPTKAAFVDVPFVSVLDVDGPNKMLFPKGFHINREPSGVIRKERKNREVQFAEFAPWTLAFRGVDADLGTYSYADMKPTGETLAIEGDNCREYRIAREGGATKTFWLDPAKDWVVHRFVTEKEGRRTRQLDITYAGHEACGWAPATWTRTTYSGKGDVLRTTKGEVAELKLNEPVAAGAFDLTFPPGAYVHDERDGKDYRVQEDGTFREEEPRMRAGFGDLPLDQPWYRQPAWVLPILAVLIAGLIGWLVFRIRRAKPA